MILQAFFIGICIAVGGGVGFAIGDEKFPAVLGAVLGAALSGIIVFLEQWLRHITAATIAVAAFGFGLGIVLAGI